MLLTAVFSLFRYLGFNTMCLCLCVPEVDIRLPRAGVLGGCELLSEDAGASRALIGKHCFCPPLLGSSWCTQSSNWKALILFPLSQSLLKLSLIFLYLVFFVYILVHLLTSQMF